MSIYFAPYEKPMDEFDLKPCPLCNSRKALFINSKSHYKELVEKNGSACLTMGCKNCDLTLTEYSSRKNEIRTEYDAMVEDLINRWNDRKEVNDESEKD